MPRPGQNPLSEDSLREAALSYLDRYDASVAQLRQVLRRRIDKYATEESAAPAVQRIEALLERFSASALLDDGRFARSFAEAARQRGASTQKIRHKLAARGIEASVIEAALSEVGQRDGLDDLAAAQAYVKKQRLLTRLDSSDPKQRARALASLGRQGFSFEIAKKALGLD